MCTRPEIHFCLHVKVTLMHYPETLHVCLTIDGQVCFHRWLFADDVKPRWCISWPEGINRASWGTKLLLMAVLASPVAQFEGTAFLFMSKWLL